MIEPRSTQHLSSIFVGRQREMAELTAALDDALTGNGRLVMLVGEPGIGKTRTAQELTREAEVRGAQVCWGWCYEEAGAPPYWPWVQPIRSYVQLEDSERLRSEMGSGAADIAEIVPTLRAKLPDLETPPDLEPEQARFRLFDSIATFLKNAARSQPLVLVLDDLHWADKPSLLLLQFLARQLQGCRLLVVGCYRDVELSRQHPLSEALAQLSREPVFQRVPMRGLSQDETGQFMEASVGIEPTTGLAEALYSHTEGNPFFITEVIRLLSESGELTAGRIGAAEGLRIPQGVREVIGQRLRRLSEQCNRVLTTASVVGPEFDFRLLNMLSGGMSEDQLLQAVDEAVSVHLIEDVPGQMDRYQFSHALIQQTLAEEVTTSRRVRLHARIGEALELLYAVEVEAHAAELAHHFAEAGPVLGPEKLVQYSRLAGERALTAYAYEDALTHFEKGLVAREITLSGTDTASDEEAAGLLFGLARAQSATVERHQLVEVFAILSRAFEFYAEAGNVAQAVAAAEFPVSTGPVRIPGVAELLARALALVPADSHEAGRLLSRYGGILAFSEGDYEGSLQALGRAMAIARLEGDVPLEVQTLVYAAGVSGNHLHWQESVDNALRAIELSTGKETPFSEVSSRLWTGLGLLHMGELDAARPHALALRSMGERRSTPRPMAGRSFQVITLLSSLEGDWSSAREHSDRGLEASPLTPRLLETRALLEHQTGEPAQGEVYLQRLLDVVRRGGPDQLFASGGAAMAITAVARLTGVFDRLEMAEAIAQAALSNPAVTPNVVISARAGLALLAAHKGDESAAAEHHAYLLGQRGTMIWTVSSVDRILALLSQTIGDMVQAATHFEDALAFGRKAGYRPELAWTCHDYADALLERFSSDARRGGSRTALTDGDFKATSLLDESLAIATELGMRPLVERVITLQEQARSRPRRAPEYPGGLSQREVEVLRLISTGKTDREIAEELFISPLTVGNHVKNILNKTNTSNRTEAATYAAHQGLT